MAGDLPDLLFNRFGEEFPLGGLAGAYGACTAGVQCRARIYMHLQVRSQTRVYMLVYLHVHKLHACAGFPFTGKTGFGAFAAHVPEVPCACLSWAGRRLCLVYMCTCACVRWGRPFSAWQAECVCPRMCMHTVAHAYVQCVGHRVAMCSSYARPTWASGRMERPPMHAPTPTLPVRHTYLCGTLYTCMVHMHGTHALYTYMVHMHGTHASWASSNGMPSHSQLGYFNRDAVMQVGYFKRDGQGKLSTACGACVGALSHAESGAEAYLRAWCMCMGGLPACLLQVYGGPACLPGDVRMWAQLGGW